MPGSYKKETEIPTLTPKLHHVYELPTDDELRYKRLFKQLDQNSDGRVCIEDLVSVFQKYGMSYADAEVFMKRSDKDRSGDLSMAEFIIYLKEHEKNLKLVFSSIDKNEDGLVDAQELREAFKTMGIRIEYIEAENLIKRIDKEGTLEITFSEWRDFFMFNTSSNISEILKFWRHATSLDVSLDSNAVPDDFTKQEMVTGMWWRHLVAGGVAGAVSRTCTAPLDRMKVFLQVHGLDRFGSLAACVRHMLVEGGVISLWRGNFINVLKIAPESALKFAAYERVKQIIHQDTCKELGMYERFAAGSFAGGFAQSVIYPMEVLKTRLAIRTTGQYKGIIDVAQKIYVADGVKGFYRGYIPNLLGIIPYAGFDLAVYETLKKRWLKSHGNGDSPSVIVLLSCGMVSSTIGQLVSYPLALVRTRLQAAAALNTVCPNGTPPPQVPQELLTMTGQLKHVVNTEGIPGLWRGIVPNFLKVAPAVSISYVVYEHVRQKLGVKMT
ncbi:mitochondrial adenyl nucleotide antiporter SLC25A23-like [Artemia franciscana]|uniref:EF-hand domain-containing protein n=1 Tax=Artemia franciscana TaxID=6661 RepID=A0AA88HD80_ARTSF|nr:hypothetical protein QYM36_018136 [Artemia franciscana]